MIFIQKTFVSFFILFVLTMIIGVFVVSNFLPSVHAYTEKRPDNFVLSEETPISIGHGIVGNLSTSTEPVDILSYGVHFRIPRNYIETILHNTRDKTVSFTLFTLFPDFAGVQSGAEGGKLTEENKIWRWKFSPNLITIDSTDTPFSPEHDPNTIVFTAEAHQPDHPWKYGLLKSMVRSDSVTDVYFQRPGLGTPGFMIGCDKDDELRICDSFIRVSENVVMQYRIHRELLPHWQEINKKIMDLVQSFVVRKE